MRYNTYQDTPMVERLTGGLCERSIYIYIMITNNNYVADLLLHLSFEASNAFNVRSR